MNALFMIDIPTPNNADQGCGGERKSVGSILYTQASMCPGPFGGPD